MKKGCAKWLAIWVALLIFYGWLVGNPVLALLFSVFMLAAVGYLAAPIRKGQELALVKEAGYSPFRSDATFFQDGRRLAVFGYIVPQHAGALKAPFSHKECVAYSYAIYTYSGEDRDKSYEGFAMTPAVIITRRGEVKLFSFPELKGFAPTDAAQMSYDNALAYLRSTSFESFKLTEIRKAYESVIEELMDDSGTAKKDTRFIRVAKLGQDDFTALDIDRMHEPELKRDDTLEETCVGLREEVCLLGTWSNRKQGIVSDYKETGRRVTLIKGNEQQVLASIRKAMIVYPLVGLAIAAVVNLIVWLMVKR